MKFTANVAKATTVMLLKGINMAAMIGVSFPETANPRPMVLYKKEITKFAMII